MNEQPRLTLGDFLSTVEFLLTGRTVHCKRPIRQRRQEVEARRRRVADFMDSHQEQTQADFLTACGVSQQPSVIALALGLRRAIAKFGRIPESYIRSEYTFTDLERCPTGRHESTFSSRGSYSSVSWKQRR